MGRGHSLPLPVHPIPIHNPSLSPATRVSTPCFFGQLTVCTRGNRCNSPTVYTVSISESCTCNPVIWLSLARWGWIFSMIKYVLVVRRRCVFLPLTLRHCVLSPLSTRALNSWVKRHTSPNHRWLNSLTLESMIGAWHTPEDTSYIGWHPWTYSVPNCSHCSSLFEWSGTSIPYWTVHPCHTEQVELSSTVVMS